MLDIVSAFMLLGSIDKLEKTYSLLWIIFFFLHFCFIHPAFSKEFWVEGKYRYYLSPFDTVATAKEKAKNFALRDALEKAISQGKITVEIRSKTVVFNGRLALDLIRAISAAKVKKCEIISQKLGEENNKVFYYVHVRVLLRDRKIRLADYGLELKLLKTSFKNGEEIQRLFLSTQKACYPYLYSVTANGMVYRLLPNAYQSLFKLKGTIQFPTKAMKKAGFVLKAYALKNGPPKQQEELLLICTQEKDAFLEQVFPDALAKSEKEIPNILSPKFHTTLEDLVKHLYELPLESWSMAEIVYEINL